MSKSLILDKLITEKLYNTNGKNYFHNYSGSLIISIFIIYLYLVIITLLYAQSQFPIIRQNWSENKCNPAIYSFSWLYSR